MDFPTLPYDLYTWKLDAPACGEGEGTHPNPSTSAARIHRHLDVNLTSQKKKEVKSYFMSWKRIM